MESVGQIDFSKHQLVDNEAELTHIVKYTLDSGLEGDGSVLNFRIPGDPSRFTQLNKTRLEVQFYVTRADGSPLHTGEQAVHIEPEDPGKKAPAENKDKEEDNKKETPKKTKKRAKRALGEKDIVFLDMQGIHSLFSSCDVKMNNVLVSSMTAYPYTTALCRNLGCTAELRENVWDYLEGSFMKLMGTSSVPLTMKVDGTHFLDQAERLYGHGNDSSRMVTFTSKVYSDVLTSAGQLLPPNISLNIEMRRAPNSFTLCTNDDEHYQLHLKSASLYLHRVQLVPELTNRALSSMQDGAHIVFNRLETRMMSVPAKSTVWNWLNCLNSDILPNRFYVALVPQASVYGNYKRISTYFDPANLASLNFKLNGRDILVDPIKMTCVSDKDGVTDYKSDFSQGFLSLCKVLDVLENQRQSLIVGNAFFMFGFTVYAVELGKAGYKPTETGVVDLEVSLAYFQIYGI